MYAEEESQLKLGHYLCFYFALIAILAIATYFDLREFKIPKSISTE